MRDPERTIVCDIIANGLTMPEGGRYEIGKSDLSTITKQRDLAVEALEWAADVLPPSDPGGIGGCDCPVCRALETIKESDGK